MRRLLLRGVLLAVAVVVTCVAILVLMPRPHVTYFFSSIDKWAAAERAPSPKLLIVGGSNTAFGIDSRMLHDSLGMPVVNFGLNAGLGLRYMLDEVGHFMEPGDVVLISPEYEQFYGTTAWGNRHLLELAWMHPATLRLMTRPRYLLALARGFPPVFQERLRSLWLDFRSPDRETGNEVYRRSAFNEFGDVVSHIGVDRDRSIHDMPLLRDTTAAFNTQAVRILGEFHDEARERGVRAFLVFPTVPEALYRLRQDRIERVHDRLRRDAGIPVLGSPGLQTGGPEDFFDTAYHLSGEGRREQTARLVGLVKGRVGGG